MQLRDGREILKSFLMFLLQSKLCELGKIYSGNSATRGCAQNATTETNNKNFLGQLNMYLKLIQEPWL